MSSHITEAIFSHRQVKVAINCQKGAAIISVDGWGWKNGASL